MRLFAQLRRQYPGVPRYCVEVELQGGQDGLDDRGLCRCKAGELRKLTQQLVRLECLCDLDALLVRCLAHAIALQTLLQLLNDIQGDRDSCVKRHLFQDHRAVSVDDWHALL